jgi:hypothetical protein
MARSVDAREGVAAGGGGGIMGIGVRLDQQILSHLLVTAIPAP